MIVGVIQKVLHMVSAVTLEGGDFSPEEDAGVAEQLMHQILQAPVERWDEILITLAREETVAGSELLAQTENILQKILFTIPAGSSKQAVMVEYVQEVQGRVRKAFGLPEAAGAPPAM